MPQSLATAQRPPRPKWSKAADLHRLPEHAARALESQFDEAFDGNVLNTRPDPIDFRDCYYEPGLVELKSRLIPRLPLLDGFEIRQQGREGSCTGQALAAVVDLQNLARLRDGASVPKRVSARMLYESARAFDEFAEDGLEGSSLRGALKGFYHRGACDAALAPYFDGDIGWRLTPEQAKDARRVGLGSYFRLRHELNAYHAAITEAGAIYCSAMIHKGWESAKVAAKGGYIPRTVPRNGRTPLVGAHAFALVGYDEEGFLVLNSWGPEWGGFDPGRAYANGQAPSVAEATAGPLPGVAHWAYDDWRDHVLDAWVLRLTAPTKRPSGYVGGYVAAKTGAGGGAKSPTAPAIRDQKIRGHYIHVDDGMLVARPPYDNDVQTFRDTAEFLKRNETETSEAARYDHLLLYAHGGLNDLDSGAERACVMTGVLKRLGIYPVFYLWRTGFAETLQDVLAGMIPKLETRTRGLGSIADALIENIGRPLGRAVWRDMKLDAERAAAAAGANKRNGLGGAWAGTRDLLTAAAARRKRPLKVHFVGHSAGAIFLGEIFDRMQKDAPDLNASVASVHLLAPACTVSFFRDKILPRAEGRPKGWLSVTNLSEAAEASPDPALRPYGKSLLYLVSNAFEEERQEPIAGMHKFWRDHVEPLNPNVDYELAGEARGALAGVRTHGGFDNDAAAMNRCVSRILGRTVDGKNGGFTRVELKYGEF